MDKVNNCVSWRPSVRSCRCQKEQVVTKIVVEVRILLCARVSPQPCHPSHGASTGQYNCMYLSVLHTYPHTQANAHTLTQASMRAYSRIMYGRECIPYGPEVSATRPRLTTHSCTCPPRSTNVPLTRSQKLWWLKDRGIDGA